MSQFVEVKTAELTGPALDWAVAKAVGGKVDWEGESKLLWFESSNHEWVVWSPSTDWAQGGPLIDKHHVGFSLFTDWVATVETPDSGVIIATESGPTHLIAACRAIVAAKLGDAVQVPAELVGVV